MKTYVYKDNGSRLNFPYAVLSGAEWPYGKIEQVFMTRCFATRYAAKLSKAATKLPRKRRLIEKFEG